MRHTGHSIGGRRSRHTRSRLMRVRQFETIDSSRQGVWQNGQFYVEERATAAGIRFLYSTAVN